MTFGFDGLWSEEDRAKAQSSLEVGNKGHTPHHAGTLKGYLLQFKAEETHSTPWDQKELWC